jgi:hypothetical protein
MNKYHELNPNLLSNDIIDFSSDNRNKKVNEKKKCRQKILFMCCIIYCSVLKDKNYKETYKEYIDKMDKNNKLIYKILGYNSNDPIKYLAVSLAISHLMIQLVL